jgi:hypothetical protein
VALSVSIQGAKCLDPGLWKARLAQSELQFLGSADSRVGPLSVLLIFKCDSFDQATGTLSFNPSSARLLNLGTSEEAIIVESTANGSSGWAKTAIRPARQATIGDSRFLTDLPQKMLNFGTLLLQAVRTQYPGALKFYERSGKYVETPDNFWTVRIQTRDESFRITVRGKPESFSGLCSLTLKADMAGYSSFKVSSPEQIEEFMSVLRQVRKKDKRN